MHYKNLFLRLSIITAIGFYFYIALMPSQHPDTPQKAKNIGLLIVATGRYVHFVEPLIKSADRFFLPGHNHTYFVFTDHINELPKQDNIIPIFQKKLGWPYDSLMRCCTYNEHKVILKNMDYIFACDADMVFVDYVGDEILGTTVATIHPGFTEKRGTYDNNPKSAAYVAPYEGSHYFAGGFYGGSRDGFYNIIEELTRTITLDNSNGTMARWHDESHINRYFIDHKPTCILNPSYCYPEGWHIGYHPRLVALYKNHAYWRA